jgi:sulfite reductase alpha subunit-like flavoprotein
VDLDKFTPEDFCSHKFVIMVLATHYEGDPTDNAKAYHKWLTKVSKSEDQLLVGMEYCMMGLGDTSYEQFNEMARFCDNAMTKLGAKRFYEVGAANAETYTTDDDFQKWKQPLWQILFTHYSSLVESNP